MTGTPGSIGSPPSSAASRRPTSTGTRFDIQLLRAFAVSVVIVYHLTPLRLPGGFVGVDIFFVISGFLITSHLLREVDSTGRVKLGAFWSRRAKRLLPSACLVLLATAVAVFVYAPATVKQRFLEEVVAGSLYFENWRLAASSVDYLAIGDTPSPVQHFWSLSTEEQFYIALPLVMVALIALAKLFGWTAKRTIASGLVVLFVASFVFCLRQTSTTPSIAYFSTATRAWEFLAGGLVALVAGSRVVRALPRSAGVALAWIGMALLVVSLVVITGSTPFPGYAAALPVVGGALVLAFGAQSGIDSIGRLWPIATLGRISYALYLWHWPLIVLVPFVTGHPLGTRSKVGIVVLSLVLAWATTVWFEEPLRFSRAMKSIRARRVALLGGASMLTVVVVSAAFVVVGVQQQQAQAAEASALESTNPACFGAATLISSAKPCVNPKLNGKAVPAVAGLAKDDANRNACWSPGDSSEFRVCTLGKSRGATKHFLAIGDSHNNALIDVYEKIADDNGWRIDVAGKGNCYWTTAAQHQLSASYTAGCAAWRSKATAYVAARTSSLDAVIVTHSRSGQALATKGRTAGATTVDSLAAAWNTATKKGLPVIAIVDNPHPLSTTQACVAKDPSTAAKNCSFPRSRGLVYGDGSASASKKAQPSAVIDLTNYYCTPTTCPAVMGGVIVYRDGTHITRTFAKTMTPYIEKSLKAAVTKLVK